MNYSSWMWRRRHSGTRWRSLKRKWYVFFLPLCFSFPPLLSLFLLFPSLLTEVLQIFPYFIRVHKGDDHPRIFKIFKQILLSTPSDWQVSYLSTPSHFLLFFYLSFLFYFHISPNNWSSLIQVRNLWRWQERNWHQVKLQSMRTWNFWNRSIFEISSPIYIYRHLSCSTPITKYDVCLAKLKIISSSTCPASPREWAW